MDVEKSVFFRLAKVTGQPQVLREDVVPCVEDLDSCAGDVFTAYAMPNGTVRITRVHREMK